MFKFPGIAGALVLSHDDMAFKTATTRSVVVFIRKRGARGHNLVQWVHDGYDNVSSASQKARLILQTHGTGGNVVRRNYWRSNVQAGTQSQGTHHTDNDAWDMFGWTYDSTGPTLNVFSYDPTGGRQVSGMAQIPDVDLDQIVIGNSIERFWNELQSSHFANYGGERFLDFEIGGIMSLDGHLSNDDIDDLWNGGDFTYFRNNASNVPAGFAHSVVRAWEFNGSFLDTTGDNDWLHLCQPRFEDSSSVFGGTWPSEIPLQDYEPGVGCEIMAPIFARRGSKFNVVLLTSDSYNRAVKPYAGLIANAATQPIYGLGDTKTGVTPTAESGSGMTSTALSVDQSGQIETNNTRTTNGAQVSYAASVVTFEYDGDILPTGVLIQVGSDYMVINTIAAGTTGDYRVTARCASDPSIANGEDVKWMSSLPVVRSQIFFDNTVAANQAMFRWERALLSGWNIQSPGDAWSMARMDSQRFTNLRCMLLVQLASSESKQINQLDLGRTSATSVVARTYESVTDVWADATAKGFTAGDLYPAFDIDFPSFDNGGVVGEGLISMYLRAGASTSEIRERYCFPAATIWYDGDATNGNIYVDLYGGSWAPEGFNCYSGDPGEKFIAPRELESLLKCLKWKFGDDLELFNIECIHDPPTHGGTFPGDMSAANAQLTYEERVDDLTTVCTNIGLPKPKVCNITPPVHSGDSDKTALVDWSILHATGGRAVVASRPGQFCHVGLAALTGWTFFGNYNTATAYQVNPVLEAYRLWAIAFPFAAGFDPAPFSGATYTAATNRLVSSNAFFRVPTEFVNDPLVFIGGDGSGTLTPGYYTFTKIDNSTIEVDLGGSDATGVVGVTGGTSGAVYGDGTHPTGPTITGYWAIAAINAMRDNMAASFGSRPLINGGLIE